MNRWGGWRRAHSSLRLCPGSLYLFLALWEYLIPSTSELSATSAAFARLPLPPAPRNELRRIEMLVCSPNLSTRATSTSNWVVLKTGRSLVGVSTRRHHLEETPRPCEHSLPGSPAACDRTMPLLFPNLRITQVFGGAYGSRPGRLTSAPPV